MSTPDDPARAQGAGADGAAQPDEVPAAPPPQVGGAPGGVGHALKALAVNLWLALRLLALRRCEPSYWRVGPGSLLALFVLHLLIGLAYDFYDAGLRGAHPDWLALPAASFWALAALLAAVVLSALGRAPAGAAGVLAVAGFALACLEALAAALLATAADYSPRIDRYYALLSWLPLAWAALAYALAAARAAAAPSRVRRVLVAAAAVACIVSPQWAVDPAARLWVADAADEAVAAEGANAAQSEQTLYGQFDLLNDALDAVAPANPGVTELFTISFAGDGRQDVFLNEAVGADAVLGEVFDSSEHSLVLANSLARPQERPFATVSALQRALGEMASRMNLDEDVLALVLTSHGSPDHQLEVALPPYQFDNLDPARLRALLDEAGIRFRVIVVSACYSGGFVAPLSGPDTMIITASAADQTSFGCRDGAQWTDFGRAYFAEALAQTASFEGAFRLSQTRIAERERAQGLPASQPQLFVGPGIRERLQRLETRSGGRILFAMTTAARRWAPAGAGRGRRARHHHGATLAVRAGRNVIDTNAERKRG